MSQDWFKNVDEWLKEKGIDGKLIEDGINELIKLCHGQAVESGWWTDLETGKDKDRNRAEMLMLIVSEISECMEGYRKNLMDDHLPKKKMNEVEMADAFIRQSDLSGKDFPTLGRTILEKVYYNAHREDHKIKNRTKEGGKKF